MRSNGVRPTDLALVVLTHGHTDHAGALGAVVNPQTPVAIGAADSALLLAGHNKPLVPRRPTGVMLWPMVRRLRASGYTADLLLKGETSLSGYGIDGSVRVVGGHTPGSSLVRVGSTAVVGDLVRGGLFRRNAGTAYRHFYCQDLGATRTALEQVVTQPVETLLVGHGGTLRAVYVRARLDVLAPRASKDPRHDP